MQKTPKPGAKDFFLHQAERKALRDSREYRSASFAFGASALLSAVLLLASVDWKAGQIKSGVIAVAAVFCAEALLTLLARCLIRRDITAAGAVRRGTRLLAPLLILMSLTGNIFSGAAGFFLAKKEKNLEYSVGVYTCLVDILLFLVSATGIFKEYVVDTFFLGLGGIAVLLVLHLAATLLAARFVHGNCADRRMTAVGIVLILTALSGNLLALLLGLMLICKARNREEEISISWIDVIKRLLRSEMAAFGLMFTVFIISMALVAQLTMDYDFATSNNYSAILQPPSLVYPFGTDDYGRCVFTRVIFGTRVSLLAGAGATLFSLLLGMVFGSAAGYYSGRVDNLVMRIMDVFLAIPGLLLPIAIVTAFGTSLPAIIIALGAGCVPRFARVVRASVLGLADSEFVEASRACGAKDVFILSRHILPNCLAPTIVQGTLLMASNIVAVSSLSYLGLGVAAHVPEWGNILKAGSTYLEQAPYLAIYPGIVVVLLVLSVNFLGDGFRDALDPKLK